MTTLTTAEGTPWWKMSREQRELDSFRLDEEEALKDFDHILWPAEYQLQADEIQWFLFGKIAVRLETKKGKLALMVMTDRGGDNAKCILNLPPIDVGL